MGEETPPIFYMGFKITNIKETAIRAFLNEWIKDEQIYCNYCGMIYTPPPEGCEPIICCDKPQLGTNKSLLTALIHENKRIRENRLNDFGSNEDKTMRIAISITPRLLHDLEEYCIHTLKEPLWKDRAEMDDFMRSFPQLCVCRKV
jgi:hypothetical protein